jgi:hypothetical protein
MLSTIFTYQIEIAMILFSYKKFFILRSHRTVLPFTDTALAAGPVGQAPAIATTINSKSVISDIR